MSFFLHNRTSSSPEELVPRSGTLVKRLSRLPVSQLLPVRIWYVSLCTCCTSTGTIPCHSYNLFIMFNFTIFRSSSAIKSITCNVLSGTCYVNYKNGTIYAYSNVSKRAMLNLKFNRTISLGFWVNNNLLGYDSRSNYALVG